jgi:glycosyltransferase involved in cell wall biosynthesis
MGPSLKISVVMPSYNHARFIREAIESVLSQEYEALDILVMDGGSTDGTVDILKSYGSRITFVSQKDKGQSDAINQGLARVKGDIVCWLNSDDLFTPGAVRTVIRAFEDHPEVDFVYGNGWAVDEFGKNPQNSGVLPFDLWKLIHQRNFIQQPSCFFRKALIEKVGPIDESLHYVMDWELWIRFAAYKGLYINEFLSFNRTYVENKTQSGYFRRWREIYRVVKKYTNSAWPPILTNYLLEILVLMMRARNYPRFLSGGLAVMLTRGMMTEMSGCYRDGSIEPRFHVSIGNPLGRDTVTMEIVPLPALCGGCGENRTVRVTWKASNGLKGRVSLSPQEGAQEIMLPARPTNKAGFVHFTFQADNPGVLVEGTGDLPSRRIIGYLKEVEI